LPQDLVAIGGTNGASRQEILDNSPHRLENRRQRRRFSDVNFDATHPPQFVAVNGANFPDVNFRANTRREVVSPDAKSDVSAPQSGTIPIGWLVDSGAVNCRSRLAVFPRT